MSDVPKCEVCGCSANNAPFMCYGGNWHEFTPANKSYSQSELQQAEHQKAMVELLEDIRHELSSEHSSCVDTCNKGIVDKWQEGHQAALQKFIKIIQRRIRQCAK